MSDTKTDSVRMGGLWMKETRDGRTFWAGEMDTTEAVEAFGAKFRVVVFHNDRKKHDRSPDYTLLANPMDTARKSSGGYDKGRREEKKSSPPARRDDGFGVDDSDIPF